ERIATLEKEGIAVFPFAGNLAHLLRKLKTEKAGMIVVLIEDEDRRSHLQKALDTELGPESECLVFVQGGEDPTEFPIAVGEKTVREVLDAEASRLRTRWVSFDPYELAAQKILTDFGPHLFVPQRVGLKTERPHLVLFGLGALARAWMKTALSSCHFRPGEKVRMTVFYDKDTDEETVQSYRKTFGVKEMRGSRLEKVRRCRNAIYPGVPEGEFLTTAELHATRHFDLHFEPISFVDLDSDSIEDVLKDRMKDDEKAVVYLAHAEDSVTLKTARILDGDYANMDHLIAKCVICIQEIKSSSRHLHVLGSNSDFMMIFPIEEVFQGQDSLNRLGDIEEKASKLHMSYLTSPESSNEIYGQKSYFLWSELPLDKKKSNRSAVLHFHVKASLFGYSDSRHWDFDRLRELFREHRSDLARLEHQRWEAFHFVEGWRLGERLDKDKTHPSLVPFEWLSQQQKDRDTEQIYAALKVM
ncbi:MAG TPA: RyR domain-containing protein, partial [Pseudobdellovibrionaceae bacterium]|nr:RyR domain-containing protein [Pseudobdellovibrionaceae bacterium]